MESELTTKEAVMTEVGVDQGSIKKPTEERCACTLKDADGKTVCEKTCKMPNGRIEHGSPDDVTSLKLKQNQDDKSEVKAESADNGGRGDKPVNGEMDGNCVEKEKPVENGGQEKTVENDGQEKPAENDGQEKPAENGHEEPAENGQEKPAENGQEKPGKNGQEKPAENGQEKPAENGHEKPAENGHEKPAENGHEKPAENGGHEKPVKNGATISPEAINEVAVKSDEVVLKPETDKPEAEAAEDTNPTAKDVNNVEKFAKDKKSDEPNDRPCPCCKIPGGCQRMISSGDVHLKMPVDGQVLSKDNNQDIKKTDDTVNHSSKSERVEDSSDPTSSR